MAREAAYGGGWKRGRPPEKLRGHLPSGKIRSERRESRHFLALKL